MIRNPGGGTPPPDFTQGGVMDCHPPPETALVPVLHIRSMYKIDRRGRGPGGPAEGSKIVL